MSLCGAMLYNSSDNQSTTQVTEQALPPAVLQKAMSSFICLQVDPKNLSPGLHHAEVIGVDSGNEWRGPLFRYDSVYQESAI